jgi:HSP20 family protein
MVVGAAGQRVVLRIPIAERAKPRKIAGAGRDRTEQKIIAG